MDLKIFSKSFFMQVSKFVIVGGLGALLNISILFVLTEVFKVFYLISEIIAFIFSALQNYLLNKIWTFKEKLKNTIIQKWVKYFIISTISLLVNLSILYILVEFFDFWYLFAEIGAIMFSFVINFIGNKIWTFKVNNQTILSKDLELPKLINK